MRFPTVLMLAAMAAPVAAQPARKPAAGLRLSLSHRTRYEKISGQARAGFGGKDALLNLRTILRAEYAAGPLTLAGEVWDSRVYGEDRRTPLSTGEVNALEPVQLYATLKAGGARRRAEVQLGRFMLNLGSRRLVAADDYRNTTNGYTGARVDLAADAWRATLIYTLPQVRRPDGFDDLRRARPRLDRESGDLTLWGGLVSRERALGATMVEASFFHLSERDRPDLPTRDRRLDTAAVRLIREPKAGRLDFEVEAIGQRGRAAASTAANAAVLPVSAWFIHGDAGYSWGGGWKPRLSVEYDQASGDRPGGRYGRFDTLFGMRRADLAPSGLYNALARTNILSPGLRLEASPARGADLMLSARPLWAASRTDAFSSTGVRDPSGRAGRYAGSQLDGRVRWRVSPALQLELDGVLLKKGRLLRDAPNAPPGRWTRYVSLNAMVAVP